MEAVWFGCVPVFVAYEQWGPPFSCFFDWRRLAVFVPAADAHRLPELLAPRHFPAARVARMRGRLLKVRAHLSYAADREFDGNRRGGAAVRSADAPPGGNSSHHHARPRPTQRHAAFDTAMLELWLKRGVCAPADTDTPSMV